MDHFMKQKRNSKGWTILWSKLCVLVLRRVAWPVLPNWRWPARKRPSSGNGVEEVLDSRSSFYSPRGERCTFFPPLCIELLCGPRTYDLGPNRDAGTQLVTSMQPPETPNRQRRCPSWAVLLRLVARVWARPAGCTSTRNVGCLRRLARHLGPHCCSGSSQHGRGQWAAALFERSLWMFGKPRRRAS